MSHAHRFFTTVLLFVSISTENGCKKAQRSTLIPNGAVELGGAKKTYYVMCDLVSAATYDCTVFSGSGRTMASSYFTLIGGDSFRPHDVSEYEGFDGDEIRLTAGRALVASAPPRPNHVPTSASWSGGPTCGAYFDCNLTDAGLEVRCRVYDDRSGELASDRHYRVEGTWDGGLGDLRACLLDDVADGGPIGIGEGFRPYLAPVRE